MKKLLLVMLLVYSLLPVPPTLAYEVEEYRTVPQEQGVDVATNGTVYVITGSESPLKYSTDLTNWTNVVLPVQDSIGSIVYGNGEFVAAGNSYLWRSNDGINWTYTENSNQIGRSALYYENGQYYGSYSSPEMRAGIFFTTDFIDYELYEIEIINSQGLREAILGIPDVCILGERIVVPCYYATNQTIFFYISDNNEDWIEQECALENVVGYVCLNDTLYVYTIENNQIFCNSTTDAVNWNKSVTSINDAYHNLRDNDVSIFETNNQIGIIYWSDEEKLVGTNLQNDYLFKTSSDGINFNDEGLHIAYFPLSSYRFFDVGDQVFGLSSENYMILSEQGYNWIERPYYPEMKQDGSVFGDSVQYYQWGADNKLYISQNGVDWAEKILPEQTKNILNSGYTFQYADGIYWARLWSYDGGLNIDRFAQQADAYDTVYKMDADMNIIAQHSFGQYVKGLRAAGNTCYAVTRDDTAYMTTDGSTWTHTGQTFPTTNGQNVIVEENSQVFLAGNGNTEILYETAQPQAIQATAGLYYYTKDTDDGMYVYFSGDGVYWQEVVLPQTADRAERIYRHGDQIYIECADYTYVTGYQPVYEAAYTAKTYVKINEKILGFDTEPVTESDRVLVPIRFIFENLDADVEWDDQTKTASITGAGTEIAVTVDNQVAKVNGADKQMDVPVRLIGDRTLVPLRFLSEELGYTVDWDNDTRTATIMK